MLCAQFVLNWPNASGEDNENVKRLQIHGGTNDGRVDRRQTTGDQKR